MRALPLLLLLSSALAQPGPQPILSPAEAAELDAALAADTPPPAAPTAAPAPASANPNIALILDTALAWFDTDTPRQLGGHDPSRTGFNLQQLELHLDANVDPFFRLDANIVFAQFGVEVEEAFATTLALPGGLQARAGQFLTRFGRVNATHPHSWDFVDQPLVLGKFFGSEGSRGLGAELSWLLPVGWYVELIGSATEATGDCCARSFYGADGLPVRDPRDVVASAMLKQFFDLSPDWGLLWGLSFQGGPNASGPDNRSEIYGADLNLRWRPRGSDVRRAVTLQAEVMYRRRQQPDEVLSDAGTYAQLVYDHDPNWATGLRYEWVDGAGADPLDPEWTTARQRFAAQLTYRPSHTSRLRLQGNYDAPNGLDDPILGAFLALEVLIGAHGAHAY